MSLTCDAPASETMKSVSKIGSKTVNVKDKVYWHHVCSIKDSTYPNMYLAAFLQNYATKKDMIGTSSKCQSFGKYYNIFKAGTLLLNSNKNKRLGKYVNVELKLVNCINHQSRLYKKDKCGLIWLFLQEKARAHALDE